MDGEARITPAIEIAAPGGPPPVRVVVLTMDARLGVLAANAEAALRRRAPNLTLSLHAASAWENDPSAADRAIEDIKRADIIVTALLFLDHQIAPVLPALKARADVCDAFVGCLSTPDIVKLTRLGKFSMDKPATGPLALLKRLRGGGRDPSKAGAHQAKMLRRLPKILKFVPGTAQDVRAYFLTMQYWLAGSEKNIENMIAALVDRYAAGPREIYRGAMAPEDPIEYPETGLYHPRMKPAVGEDLQALPLPAGIEASSANTDSTDQTPTIGLLIMRSYVLSGDADHYDGVVAAFEAKGMRVIPAFASGLDARPAIEKFFFENGVRTVDAVVSLTGFSLVGGPAYNDAGAAEAVLRALDVPYIAAQALEFQSLNEWGAGVRGLSPVEATMMVALPELDGATGPIVFGGRVNTEVCGGCRRACRFQDGGEGPQMRSCPERADMLAARVEALVRLRKRQERDRRVAIILYNFPPNSGATGTAAHLSVFESLHNLLKAMAADGYDVTVPESVEALRAAVLSGAGEKDPTAAILSDANVHDRVSANDHVRRETRLSEIEAEWGPAPGRHQSDGRAIDILGAAFGNIFVGVQPSFGYEGDPMRLLFEGGFAPTHAFSAFYRYVREDFGADAVLHFGTHGALEFMPGKQSGLSGDCWSDYLIGSAPNFYFYAANNPSEAAIAKRRSAATTISYLTPAVTKAELYKGLANLKATIDRRRATPPEQKDMRERLAKLAQTEAAALSLAEAEPEWSDTDVEANIDALQEQLFEYEQTLIPHGLHVAGRAPSEQERRDLLTASLPPALSEATGAALVEDVLAGTASTDLLRKVKKSDADPIALEAVTTLTKINDGLLAQTEIPGLLAALNGGYVPPAPGGDVLRNPDVLPTGRNIHGFDPFRMPSAFAVADGARQAERLIARHQKDGVSLPETVAIVLWGTDNLKSEGAQIAQALALMGAKPRYDAFGRLAGAELAPLNELDRPRIDVVVTLSGIFRDLLPMQTRMLAEAAQLAAAADEPEHLNFVRKHALAYQKAHGCDLDTAALRVFSNADGAYGANVNQLVDAGAFMEDEELGDAYKKRKCFAYGVSGAPMQHAALLDTILADVDVAYQNLESVDLGVTTIDHYFDTLGGISRAVKTAKGEDAAVYIGDQTQSDGVVRTLNEQVALETRTRTLNPKWYEGMLNHGYEGVRQIEAQVTNTMGWSATTAAVAPWVYQEISETFVLDKDLRDRLAALNPKSCARVANRLIEASDRNYWTPDEETLEALRRAGEELEDRLEGVFPPSEGAVL
ncbi:MAG: magnesium chelatase subunit H [Pseudomonadota bacterium]